MRAIFYSIDKSDIGKKIIVTDEAAKHLQVVRIRMGEEVLVLNGKGLKITTKVESITKFQVELAVLVTEECKISHGISLAIAVPKKDAFEDILKMATELGVRHIYPLRSEFSQYDYEANERFQRILESALVQSNNAYMPKIHKQIGLEQFLVETKAPLYFFNSRPSESGKLQNISGEKFILIGPEGGFSDREAGLIMSRPEVYPIHLSTPILRSPTAVATSLGYLLSLE